VKKYDKEIRDAEACHCHRGKGSSFTVVLGNEIDEFVAEDTAKYEAQIGIPQEG
jgi:hypothetical protein